MNEQQKRGALIFFGEGGCSNAIRSEANRMRCSATSRCT
jgi:hypothetical protein